MFLLFGHHNQSTVFSLEIIAEDIAMKMTHGAPHDFWTVFPPRNG
jgi:hypothetical protein